MRKPAARIIRKYLIYFLTVLLLPVLGMSMIYFLVSDTVSYNAYQQALASIESSARVIRGQLEGMQSLTYHIAQNQLANQFFVMDSFEEDKTIVSDVFEAQKTLSAFTVANQMISGIQLYSRKADCVIDARTGAIRLDRYYDSVFSVEGYDMETWRETFLLQAFHSKVIPSQAIYDGHTTKRRITFIQSVPMDAASHLYGNILMYIDEADLLRLFEPVTYRDGGMLRVMTSDGTLILEDNPGGLPAPAAKGDAGGYGIENLGGVEQLVIRYDDGLWQYICAIPRDHIVKSTREIRNLLVILIAATVASGLFLAFFLAYKTSQPVLSVYQQLTSSGSVSPNELGGEIAGLVKRNQHLKDLVEEQLPAQRTALVYNLLSGGFSDEGTLRSDFAKLGIPLEAGSYPVMVAVLTDLDSTLSFQEIGVLKEMVKELLWAGISNVIGVCDMDFEHIVLLAAPNEEDSAALRERLAGEAGELSHRAREDVGISLFFSSCVAEGLREIPAAFLRVQNAVRFSVAGGRENVHWCDAGEMSEVFYPENVAAQLFSAVKEGRTSVFFELWKSIEGQNATSLSGGGTDPGYRLLQMLYTTLLKIAAELPDGNESFMKKYEGIASEVSARTLPPGEIYARLQEAYLEAAVLNAENALSRTALLVRILEHVDKNFSDPQISLASVADLFRLNEVYLSRIFKQNTGENFSRYIEALRMQNANDLMKEKRYRISEISDMVGYNSPQAFRRAYKRCFGISPSQFED